MKSTISRTEQGNRVAATVILMACAALTLTGFLARAIQGEVNPLLTFFLVSAGGILNLSTACLLGVQYLYNGKRYFAQFGCAFLLRGLFMFTEGVLLANQLAGIATHVTHAPFWLWLMAEASFAAYVMLSVRSYSRTRSDPHIRPGYKEAARYGATVLVIWATTSLALVGTGRTLATPPLPGGGVETLALYALFVAYVVLWWRVAAVTRLSHKLFLLVWVVVTISLCELLLSLTAPSDASYQWYAARLLALASPGVATLALVWEITRQYQSLALTNTDLVEKVFVDPLTHIYNRRYFDNRIRLVADRVQQRAIPLSLLLIDIDFFKQVNDRYGHPFGDAVLQRIATTIQHCIRLPSDFAVRLGGEEFAVVLPEIDQHAALRVADRIRESVKRASTDMLPEKARDKGEAITISVGIATWQPGEPLVISAMLERADKALYQAKHKGRDQSVLGQLAA
ncbi:putative diguanylate cyclase YcdT [Pandoraea eparura]|uniref:diguanylate cyclase n=1 Tax=Pandoraea eparura TaxID=2508291 RepID=A0A5E4SDQ8_9BURK|nr:diguanylate cyclase [Pandoraea eparura]VVD72189.1 putative diguanylate cyclase YcdT [Pandoraea eparura]